MLSFKSVEIVDITEAQYHAETGIGQDKWITRGILHEYLASPEGCHLRHVVKSPWAKPNNQTGSMKLGSYLDVMVTEGIDALKKQYVTPLVNPLPDDWVTPSGGVSTRKDVKEQIKKAISNNVVIDGVPETKKAFVSHLAETGREMFDKDTAAKAEWMHLQLCNNPLCAHIIKNNSGKQITIRAILDNGLRVQCRIDLWCPDFGILSDLKTTNVTKERFLKSAITYGYHLQDWFYSELAIAAGFELKHPLLFTCAMNDYPWAGYVVELPEEVRAWAGRQCMKALNGIHADDWGNTQDDTYKPFIEYWMLNLMDASDSE